MSEPLPRFTKGQFGRLSFGHMNTVLDAVDRFNKQTPKGEKVGAGRKTYVAKLTTTASTTAVTGYTTWNWQGVSVASATIGADTDLVQSSDFPSGSGTAIDLGDSGEAGAYVLLHEVVTSDGVRFFGFNGSGAGLGFGVLLRIDSAAALATNRWTYSVTECTINGSGTISATSTTGTAFNTYETSPFGHGQDLTLAEADLTVAECEGYVTGIRVATGLYIFEATNPMDPTCTSTLVDGGTWS